MGDRKVQKSVRLDADQLEEIETEVEESIVFENVSQYVRAALRSFRQSDGEFDEAR